MNEIALAFIIIVGVVVAFAAVLYLFHRWINKTETNPPVTPTSQLLTEKISIKINKVDVVYEFFKDSKKAEGYKDASENDLPNNLELGKDRIKEQGIQLCDDAILECTNKIKILENEIKEEEIYIAAKGSSIESAQANRIKVDKGIIEEILKDIEAKKESLKNNNKLPIYVTYEEGFDKGRNEQVNKRRLLAL